MQYIPLTELSLSTTAMVHRVSLPEAGRRRLLDLGFAPGVPITPLFHSPLGDPTAYEIMGSIIALRREDAMQIEVNYPMGEALK